MGTTTINLNRHTKCLLRWLGAAFVVAMLAWAGRADYNEEVLAAMPRAAYEAIVQRLGEEATETEIVDEYMQHREHWDREARQHGPH